MKAFELIDALNALHPETEITVKATASQSLTCRLDGAEIVPDFKKKFDERRGSLAIHRAAGEVFVMSDSEGKVIAEIQTLSPTRLRITAPRSITIMRSEIQSNFIKE